MASVEVVSPLLDPGEPNPVGIVNPDLSDDGRNDARKFLLIGDHAGRRIPRRLADLGLAGGDLERHIAWDIGIRALGGAMAQRLGVPFVHQRYSRLVIDCNRDPDWSDAIPAISDGTPIPGNTGLSNAERGQRIVTIHEPYQQAIGAALDPDTILVSLHSFTPCLLDGEPRPWHAGVLHDGGNTGFALACLAELGAEPLVTVGDNEPYAMNAIDYTVPRHAYPSRPYVEFEVRQDLISFPQGIAEWAERLARVVERAAAAIGR